MKPLVYLLVLLCAPPLVKVPFAAEMSDQGTPGIPATVNGLLGDLDRDPKRDRADQLVAALAEHGDVAVSAIRRYLQQGGRSSGFVHRSVSVLERIGTPSSRAFLLDMALGHVEGRPFGTGPGSILEAWAAGAYLRSAPTKQDAEPLLASRNPRVVNSALIALRGQQVDRGLLDRICDVIAVDGTSIRDHVTRSLANEHTAVDSARLAELVTSETRHWALIRCNAAAVLGADPSCQFPQEAADAIGRVLDRVDQLPGATEQFQHTRNTYAEYNYHCCLNPLASLAAPDAVLRALAEARKGSPRDAVVIALARRGDASVHDGLLEIVQDGNAGMFRAWAVYALQRIATPADAGLLARLASEDAFTREETSDIGPTTRTAYPVREAATRVLRDMATGKPPE
jgi:hypothetical protein